MISALIREFLLPLLIFLFVRSALRQVLSSFRKSAPRPSPAPPPPPPPSGGVLHKDPVCGTYVTADSAHTRTVRGELVYFCSAECRERYHAA